MGILILHLFVSIFALWLILVDSIPQGQDRRSFFPHARYDDRDCGYRRPPYKGRIWGGEIAPNLSWPWMVQLRWEEHVSDEERHLCGASLINKEWVITAAHCVIFKHQQEKTVVVLMEHQLTRTGQEVSYDTICYEFYPNFDVNVNKLDFALVKFAPRIDVFTDLIRPVCLPWGNRASANLIGSLITIIGFGTNENKDSFLRQVNLTVVDAKAEGENGCMVYPEQFPSQYPGGVNNEEGLCTKGATRTQDACSGDSGSPVIKYDSVAKIWIQYGVHSKGWPCDDQSIDIPSYNQRINNDVLQWIKNKTVDGFL